MILYVIFLKYNNICNETESFFFISFIILIWFLL